MLGATWQLRVLRGGGNPPGLLRINNQNNARAVCRNKNTPDNRKQRQLSVAIGFRVVVRGLTPYLFSMKDGLSPFPRRRTLRHGQPMLVRRRAAWPSVLPTLRLPYTATQQPANFRYQE